MEKNSIIYKQFYKKIIPLNEMSGLQWFALTKNYGTSYGDLVQTYEFIQKPKLLDIGNGSIREKIEETILPYDSSILIYSDPDEQYSGGRSNKMYHELLKKYFEDSFDGTIIDENHLESGEKFSKEDLEGPSEIVLWKDFSLLLKEII
jgi:hypothetical protein